MPRLQVIIASTRPGRLGLPIGTWFAGAAVAHGAFEVDFADLAEVALPFMDEPNHPRLRNYLHRHTIDWSARVGAADAFVFVTAEYNAGYPAPLKNAIDFLYDEWKYKPVGFVSYGGVSAGTRCVQMLKQVVTTLRMIPVLEAVSIPFVAQLIDHERRFVPTELVENAAVAMLDELDRVQAALAPLRKPSAPFA